MIVSRNDKPKHVSLLISLPGYSQDKTTLSPAGSQSERRILIAVELFMHSEVTYRVQVVPFISQ